MCGIVAYLNFETDQAVDRETLGRMTQSLNRRGPDDVGLWLSKHVGLGHRRLAIIDLSAAGRGPMSTEDGSLVVTFNGEIYNFLELRPQLEAKGYRFRTQTDTEVILHAYAEWGVDCLSHFNGMFAFALWDAHRQRLFVARDRFGVKPLVYYHDHRRFVCASELKALFADRQIPRNLDPIALHHYLSLMNVPAPFTIYQGIRKLRPGHYLLVENGRAVEKRWWTLQLDDEAESSEEDAIQRLEWLLNDSVRLRLISDAPLGAFLSGGVDSSMIAGLAARQLQNGKLRTFSVTFRGEETFDESKYSRQVAQHIGSDHTETDLRPDFLGVLPEVVKVFDEPFAVASGLALYMMARETAKHVKVVLTGDGGDEVFGGYYRHTALDHRFDKLARLPFSSLRRLNRRIPQPLVAWKTPSSLRRAYQLGVAFTTPDEVLRPWRYVQMLYVLNENEKFAVYTPQWAAHLKQVNDYQSTDEFLSGFMPATAPNRLAAWRYFDFHTKLSDEMLSKVDKATMAWGLEARTPYLDYRVVEYAMRLPARLLVQGDSSKHLLKRVGERYVPKEVLYRTKQGFVVPLKPWFREELPSLLNEALDSQALAAEGIFQPAVIQQMIARNRQDDRTDLSQAMLSVAWFALWRSFEPSRPREDCDDAFAVQLSGGG